MYRHMVISKDLSITVSVDISGNIYIIKLINVYEIIESV